MGDRTKTTPLNKDISNSLHVVQKYAHRFVREHYLFREAKSIYCLLQRTDNGKLCGPIFISKAGYFVNYLLNIFRNTRSFDNWEYSSVIPQFSKLRVIWNSKIFLAKFRT